MSQRFDVVVVGSGAGGSTAASALAEAGRSVAIVDDRPYGGTCMLRGCEPKKVLVSAEDVVDWSRREAKHGALSGAIEIDWPGLMRFKHTFTDPVPAQLEEGFKKQGIATFHGEARFTDESTMTIGDTQVQAENFVIASGASPIDLHITGEEYVLTSDDFLDLTALPERMVFIGGGYISFEFAHLVSRAGVKATILHRGSQPLENFDPDIVAKLTDATRELGVDVRLNEPVTGVERNGDRFVVHAQGGDYEAGLVVHGAGRAPNVRALALENAKVAYEKHGISVNAFMQSISNPRVYAAGDSAASGAPQLTPVAELTGNAVAENLLHGNRRQVDLSTVPSIVFTAPTLAAVGMSEAKAREQFGNDVVVNTEDISSWFTYRRTGETTAAFKTILHKSEDRVLGAHVIGGGADQLINLFAFAIVFRLPATRLRDFIFAYPTYGSDFRYML
jgi:glutathione reductase (NADPH)